MSDEVAAWKQPGEVEVRRGEVTGTGLVLPDDLTAEEWQGWGSPLVAATNVSAWALGDWLFYAQERFDPEVTVVALQASTGLDPGLAARYLTVAERWPQHRRRPDLSHSHHDQLGRIGLPEDAADEVLERAAAEGWSVHQMIDEARVRLASDGRVVTDGATGESEVEVMQRETVTVRLVVSADAAEQCRARLVPIVEDLPAILAQHGIGVLEKSIR